MGAGNSICTMNTTATSPSSPDWLDRAEFPFANHYYQVPIGRMHYVDEGQGEPIVMVHGNPGWSFEYRNVIKAMSDTHRCLAPDLIGFGLSDKPADWDYRPESHARNFSHWMDHLDLQKITLVVNDWGGPVGLSYALAHPERIKRLVILNTWLWSVENDPHFKRFSGFMGGPVGIFLTKNFNFFGKAVVKKAVGDAKKLEKRIHRHYYDHMGKRSERKGAYVFPREIIRSSQWLDSLWQQREKINQIPTTFIWGMKDIAFREKELNNWTDNWEAARVVKLPEVGHFPQEEAPDAVVAELQRGV
jgi:haloalkane dehalogenase